MADNLPLIPGKGGTCADVRAVLREVFREVDYLPPLHSPGDDDSPDEWGAQYRNTCAELQQCASSIRRERAARLAHVPPHNTFALHRHRTDHGDTCDVSCRPSHKTRSPTARGDARPITQKKECERRHALLRRNDLVPLPNSTAARDGTLWVENILSRSSGDVSELVALTTTFPGPAPSSVSQPEPWHPHLTTLQDQSIELSLGPVRPYVSRPAPSVPPAPVPPQTVVCVPPQIDFINFVIGQSHTVTVRVMNVSTAEVRLAVLPPARRELGAALGGRLTVTSGAATELFITFTPKDACAVSDKLTIRVSLGCDHVLPIECYYVPPILDVLVPNVIWSSLSCDAGVNGGVAKAEAVKGPEEAVVDLGARLLGDVHFASLLLHSDAAHAQFFILTEDAWLTCDIAEVQWNGSLRAEQFVMQPAWWRGGGASRGSVWCAAQHAGLQAVALRVLSSTAVVRPLHLLADALYFRPDHITLQAHDKDYDICSDDDPACEYFVNLGTAFPHRSLSATVTLLNHSPVTYSYFWSVRPWGKCSCWPEEMATGDWLGAEDDPERLCVGAIAARDRDLEGTGLRESEKDDPTRLVRIEPPRGTASARSSSVLHVCAPDVGGKLGTRRAVLMLVLKDIPKESFPSDFEPMVLSTTTVQSEPIPGMKTWVREVCEVVYMQLEVWWEVVPVRFVIDPPIIMLPHSRRVKQMEVTVRATQLFGNEPVEVRWHESAALNTAACSQRTLAALRLAPATSVPVTLNVLLPPLSNEQVNTDIITMETTGSEGAPPEWMARVRVVSHCDTRHASLRPALAWLGVVPPGQHMHAVLALRNDTLQNIYWWAEAWRWYGENEPSTPCVGRIPCTQCHEAVCSCALLQPTRGALDVDCVQEIVYDVKAPNHDGCVATLVRAMRCGGDVGRAPSLTGSEARATLLAYRVLAPRLMMRVLPCGCDDTAECGDCTLDTGEDAKARRYGSYALRPERALYVGRRACYRMRITNLTPTVTTVAWSSPLDGEEYLKIMFIPNQINVGSYAEVEIKVVLEPRRVVARRLWVRCAAVAHAYRPLYLIVDACVAGVELEVELPLGGEDVPTSTVTIRKTQREVYPWESPRCSPPPAHDFAVEDEHRRIVRENVCPCKCQLVYDPPPRPLPPDPLPEDYYYVEIVRSPPVRRECACGAHGLSMQPTHERPLCIQFWGVPLRTVRSRTIWLRNTSVVTTRWNARVRRWPREQYRTLDSDRWAATVRAPGVALQVSPARGILAANARAPLSLRVYADTWGVYYDQLLIQMEHLDPLVVDVWVEVVGSPLQFALKPLPARVPLSPGPPLTSTTTFAPDREHAPCLPTSDFSDTAPVVWMSAMDEERCVRARNTSRSALTVHAYMLREEEREHHKYPLRLYLRFFDLPPGVCACLDTFLDPKTSSESTLPLPEPDTGMELYLAEDFGPQDFTYYEVEPEVSEVSTGACAEWRVRARCDGPLFGPDADPYAEPQPEPRHTLLLRLIPLDNVGEWWRRLEPTARAVRVRGAVREGQLSVSVPELRIELCALDLPPHDTLRLRKRFRVQNVGAGWLECCARAVDPWIVVCSAGMRACGAGCYSERPGRVPDAHISLPPRASNEMCVEVCIVTREVWPPPALQPWLARCSPPCAPPCGPTCMPPMRHPCPMRMYADTTITTENLYFYNNNAVIKTLPLVLQLYFPMVRLQPKEIDFSYVCAGDTRKSYFEISHTSRTKTLDLVVQWVGGEEFTLKPQRLCLAPDTTQRIYVQYTAEYQRSPVEGWMVVQYAGGLGGLDSGAGTWCRAAGHVRAEPSRDYKCHKPPHDYTDDTCLMPPI